MMEEIKACPYCGSDNISITSTWGKYYGKCDGCGACGPEAHNYTDAALLWNTAANALSKKDEEIALLEEQYEKEYTKLFAAMRKIDVLERHLIETTDRAMIAELQRDEARRVARQLYATNKELISILTRSTLDGLDNFTRLEKLLATRNEPPTSVDKESE